MNLITYNNLYNTILSRWKMAGVEVLPSSILLHTLADYQALELASIQETVNNSTQPTNIYDSWGEQLTSFANMIGISRTAGTKSTGIIRIASVDKFEQFELDNKGAITISKTDPFIIDGYTFYSLTTVVVQKGVDFVDLILESSTIENISIDIGAEVTFDTDYDFSSVNITTISDFIGGEEEEDDNSLKNKFIDTINSYNNAIGNITLTLEQFSTIESYIINQDEYYPNLFDISIEPADYLHSDIILSDIRQKMINLYPYLNLNIHTKELYGIDMNINIHNKDLIEEVHDYIVNYLETLEDDIFYTDVLKSKLIEEFGLKNITIDSIIIGPININVGSIYYEKTFNISAKEINLSAYTVNDAVLIPKEIKVYC